MRFRSTDPITAAGLRRLAEIARQDRNRMFVANPNRRPTPTGSSRSRCVRARPCTTGWAHGRQGLRRLDLLARAPGRPHPGAALFRRRKVAGCGPSRFGRTSTAPSWVEGRRIDLFARSLDAPPSSDGAQAIRHWLSDRRTPSAARLSEKAVIEIDPVPGRVIWPPL